MKKKCAPTWKLLLWEPVPPQHRMLWWGIKRRTTSVCFSRCPSVTPPAVPVGLVDFPISCSLGSHCPLPPHPHLPMPDSYHWKFQVKSHSVPETKSLHLKWNTPSVFPAFGLHALSREIPSLPCVHYLSAVLSAFPSPQSSTQATTVSSTLTYPSTFLALYFHSINKWWMNWRVA